MNDAYLDKYGLSVGSVLTVNIIEDAGEHGFKRATPRETEYHTQGLGNEGNLKFTSKVAESETLLQKLFTNRYGRYEIVVRQQVDGTYRRVNDNINMGTLNRGNNPISHVIRDIVPYKLFGNRPND